MKKKKVNEKNRVRMREIQNICRTSACISKYYFLLNMLYYLFLEIKKDIKIIEKGCDYGKEK